MSYKSNVFQITKAELSAAIGLISTNHKQAINWFHITWAKHNLQI